MSHLVHVPWGCKAGSILDASQPFTGWEVFMILIFIKCEDWIRHCKVIAEQLVEEDLGFLNIVFPGPSQEISSRDNVSIGFRAPLTLICFFLEKKNKIKEEKKFAFCLKHSLCIGNRIFQQEASG